jgi:hypothetical protein
MRLSTNDEHADVRNNIIYTTASGSRLAMLADSGVMDLRTTWLRTGWVISHSSFSGTSSDHGNNLNGTAPGFYDFATQDFILTQSSPGTDTSGPLHIDSWPDHDPARQYVRHQRSSVRPIISARDLGALEAGVLFVDGLESGDTGKWSSEEF